MRRILFALFVLLIWPAPVASADTIYHVDGICICEPELIPGHPFEIIPDTDPDPIQTAEERALDLLHEPPPEPDVPDLWVIVCRFIPYPPVPPVAPPTEGEGGSDEGEGGTEGGPSEGSPSEGEGGPGEGAPVEGGGGEGTVPEPGLLLLIGVAAVIRQVRR